MDTIHAHVIGIDKALKRNPLHKYGSCLPNKTSKAPHERTSKHKSRNHTILVEESTLPSPSEDDPFFIDDPEIAASSAGQHFHMDFGFVRGSKYVVKSENNPSITSIDGYNSYLIIVDRVTRYIWIFLTISKAPPITIAQKVLHKFKCKNPHRTVQTDQGGTLGMSHEFQKMVGNENFL